MNSGSKLILSAVACVFGISANYAGAKTFVIPHILERSGTISNTQFTFDTTIFATYTGSMDAPLGMQFFGNNEAPFECVGGPMPPFSTTLTVQQPDLEISMETIADPCGGFPNDGTNKLGFGIIVVGGADADAVNLQGFVVNAHTSPFDLSVFGFDPQPILAEAAVQRTYVIPHVLETSGTLSSTQTSPVYDTEISMIYTGDMGDAPSGATSMCTVTMTAGGFTSPPMVLGTLQGLSRKHSIRMDDFLTAAGLPPDFGGPVTFDVTGDAWAFASTAFVQHGLDVNNLDDESFFINAMVPEPTTLAAVAGLGLVALRRRRA